MSRNYFHETFTDGRIIGLPAASIRNMQQVLHALRTKCERCPMLLGFGLLLVLYEHLSSAWSRYDPGPKRFNYIALLSAFEQIHYAYDSKWVSVALHCAFWTFKEVVSLQHCLTVRFHGWCHVKLLLSRGSFCVHHIAMHQITVSFYSKPNMWVACVQFNKKNKKNKKFNHPTRSSFVVVMAGS